MRAGSERGVVELVAGLEAADWRAGVRDDEMGAVGARVAGLWEVGF